MDFQSELEAKFYTQSDSLSSVFRAASNVCYRGGQINGAIFSSAQSINKLARRLQEGNARVRGFRLSKMNPCLLESRISPNKLKSSRNSKAMAFFWESKRDSVVFLLSCQQRFVFDYLCSKLHAYILPDLSRVFLKTKEIRAVLNSLAQNSQKVRIRVREYTSKSLIGDPQSDKKVRTNREWTDEDYASVFEKITDRRRWISSLTLDISGESVASGKIRRNATFSCTHGFSFFFNTVVRSLTEAVIKSRIFFENRDRLSNPNGLSRPLKIFYKNEIFSDKSQNKRLIECLQRMKGSGLSIFHPNPYLHASLVDYNDGSSYDIWVTGPSAILLIPKRKSTTESIERVCNHICDEFEEGEVVNFCED